MIFKSFKLDELKNSNAIFYLFYGENEGQKDDAISGSFLDNFKGEVIKYDEKQILDDKNTFFETCLNESLFEEKKIIIVSRVTSKLFEVIEDLIDKNINNKTTFYNQVKKQNKQKNKIKTKYIKKYC